MANVTESGPRDPININSVHVPYSHKEFPKMLYHPTLPPAVVRSVEEGEALRETDTRWANKPYAKTAAQDVQVPMHPPATLFSLAQRMGEAERTILLQEQRIAKLEGELESALGAKQGAKEAKHKS